jgi:histone-lysine N-methyltransferase SETD3
MLFPALCAQVPEAFPLEIFGEYRRFALAHDVWTSYAMKVQDPASLDIREVIVPGVYLCNHALHAHSVRYTSLERDTKAFRLELARGASPGEPITISYGRLENAELVAYYGFSLANNPYDRLPFAIPGFDPANIDSARAEALRRVADVAELDVTTFPARVAADGSLDRFLAQMRALYAPHKVIEWSEAREEYHPFVIVDVAAECEMLRALAGYFKDAAEEMRAAASRVAARPRDGAILGVDVVAEATFWYRAGQLRIAESVIERIDAMLTEYSRNKRTRDRRDA